MKMVAIFAYAGKYVVSGFIISMLFLLSCAPAVGQTIISSENNTKPPPMPSVSQPYPDKGNPKLDSFLNQLIAADKKGEAEALARSAGYSLISDNSNGKKVKVEIEAMPAQLDSAVNVTSVVGKVGAIGLRSNGFDAVVPISSLESLAADKSIRHINRPAPIIFP
jgi:hypothetical protein